MIKRVVAGAVVALALTVVGTAPASAGPPHGGGFTLMCAACYEDKVPD